MEIQNYQRNITAFSIKCNKNDQCTFSKYISVYLFVFYKICREERIRYKEKKIERMNRL